VLGENRPCLPELIVAQVENVDAPGAAQFDVADAELVEDGTLFLEIVIDFVGESGQRPHAASLSFG